MPPLARSIIGFEDRARHQSGTHFRRASSVARTAESIAPARAASTSSDGSATLGALSGRFELGQGWSLWRWVWLRGAGFPAAMARELGSAELAAAMDALIAADDAVERPRRAALEACQVARPAAPDHEGLRRALNRLRKDRAPV